jgi:hypothetical protein
MAYQINFSKLNEMGENLDARSFALLIVIAEFNRPVEEEEVFAKVDEYGLEKMNDDEILEWIENWKEKHKHLLN